MPDPDYPANDPRGGECPQGYFCPNGTTEALPCSNGTLGYEPKLCSQAQCLPCLAGYYCLATSILPIPCPPGYYCPQAQGLQACPAGTYRPGGCSPPTVGLPDSLYFVPGEHPRKNLVQFSAGCCPAVTFGGKGWFFLRPQKTHKQNFAHSWMFLKKVHGDSMFAVFSPVFIPIYKAPCGK